MIDTEDKSTKKSSLISRNVTVHGKRTSMRLEPEMWVALYEISKRERCTIHRICSVVQDKKHVNSSLTAAIRVFAMAYYRAATTEEGHARAGHSYALNRQAVSNQNNTDIRQKG